MHVCMQCVFFCVYALVTMGCISPHLRLSELEQASPSLSRRPQQSQYPAGSRSKWRDESRILSSCSLSLSHTHTHTRVQIGTYARTQSHHDFKARNQILPWQACAMPNDRSYFHPAQHLFSRCAVAHACILGNIGERRGEYFRGLGKNEGGGREGEREREGD